MTNTNNKKKLRAVLSASICGSVLFTAIVIIYSWVRDSHDPGTIHGWFADLIYSLIQFACFILDMIMVFVMTSFGFHHLSPDNMNIQYIVNALDGAIIFGLVAMFWQFIVKKNYENNK